MDGSYFQGRSEHVGAERDLKVVHCGQVDGGNFKTGLSTEALKKMDLVINRSAPMAARVTLDRAANGGAAAIRAQVLQTDAADRGGCPPDQAAPPVCFATWPHLIGPHILTGVCLYCLYGSMNCAQWGISMCV